MRGEAPATGPTPEPRGAVEGSAGRAERIARAAEEIVREASAGLPISDTELSSRYPDLMPELAQAVRRQREIRRQIAMAARAGPQPVRVIPLSLDQLEAAIDEAQTAMPDATAGQAPGERRVTGYRILGELGSGGQGTVFAGVQETTGRRVAIKILAGGALISSRSRARFELEVQALAALDHPGIVGIIDRGQADDRSPYLVMEFIEGVSLDTHLTLLRQGGAAQRHVVSLFLKMAQALGYAHGAKYVHRDVKPSNVRVDFRGEPHLLDFGLAHFDATAHGGARLTVTGHVIGSLVWASPEQANGEAGKLGPASDVYSLGLMLYQALAGRPPYPVVGGVNEMIRSITTSTVAPLDSWEELAFGPVDPALAAVVYRALSRSIEGRYADAGQMAADLEAWLLGKPNYAPPPKPGPRFVGRPRWVLAASVGVAAALALLAWRMGVFEPRDAVAPPLKLPTFVNSVGMRMVEVPAGRNRIGADATWSQQADEREVTFTRAFYVGATEVTRGQYRRVMGGLPDGAEAGGDDLPVDHVTWEQATAFCERLSASEGRRYVLPTDAQWEYACLGGRQGLIPRDAAGEFAWFKDNSGGVLHSVASKRCNNWGLYDMMGSVQEWCQDAYLQHLPTAAAVDPPPLTGPEGALRVLRNGSYMQEFDYCQPFTRGGAYPSRTFAGIGFRVVIDSTPATAPAMSPGNSAR